MSDTNTLSSALRHTLPDDAAQACLVGRIWQPGVGPVLVAVAGTSLLDLSSLTPTSSQLLALPDPAAAVLAAMQTGRLPVVAQLDAVLANSDESQRDTSRAWLLPPCDLQAVKASGVTFVASLLERVIEEQARGDASRAESIRKELGGILGDNLAGIVPGSAEAARVKEVLQAQGVWSQYLEVGIGPDAEVFTKAPVLASVGCGDDIGIRSDSAWNNPEPEVVLAVNSRGQIVGATLGNDVNLRDIEGRSALLLGKAKDNNGSCALGPFIRVFDGSFGLEQVRNETVHLRVVGADGFELRGINTMASISRDPADLVAQTLAAHQYPDGFMLFMGTLFAPIEDRDQPGGGFTHHLGDLVSIQSAWLGGLHNRVAHSEAAPPWRFGLRAFMANLAQRGRLQGTAL